MKYVSGDVYEGDFRDGQRDGCVENEIAVPIASIVSSDRIAFVHFSGLMSTLCTYRSCFSLFSSSKTVLVLLLC